MDNKILIETLHKALEMEKKGYQFYKDTAQKSRNGITRKTFAFLAENEVFHIENIKVFYESLQKKGDLPALALEKVDAARSQGLQIFSKDLSAWKERINPNFSDKDAYEFAMEFEKEGYAYYEDLLQAADNENLKTLLRFLLAEENKHYDLLMKAYAYLTDTQNWFMYEEESFPQG